MFNLSRLTNSSHFAAEFFCWTITGGRQAARLQGLYFKTLLRQEIGFFDTEMTMGQVVGMMSTDAIIIQNAISDKVKFYFIPQ